MGRGKHFIGDFLPPDELEKFMETFKALKVTGKSLDCSLLLGQAPAVPSGALAHRGSRALFQERRLFVTEAICVGR